MIFRFNENEKTMTRTLLRDAGLHASKLGNKELYKYSKRIMSKFNGTNFDVDLKLTDISNIRSLTEAGYKILNESYKSKDSIDEELSNSKVESDEDKAEKEEQIKENEVLFEMNRIQVEILKNLSDRLKLIEGDLNQTSKDNALKKAERK